ncbi:MAG TPA: AAA family ATPase [Gemmataceae bacterium]|nr:AAA family ATPase [Gemmataceae bacterium]
MTNKKPKNANGQRKANGAPHASREGVYFLSITLENVRCFGEKQTLDLSDGNGKPAQWTILLGNNGTGKTSVLQAVAYIAAIRSELDRRNVVGDDAPIPRSPMWIRFATGEHGFFRFPSVAPVKLEAKVAFGADLDASARQFRTTGIQLESKRDPVKGEWQDQNCPFALVCFGYGAARRMTERSLPEDAPDTGTETLFSYHADLRNAEDWLLRADYAASKDSPQRKRQLERLEQVKQLLLAILPEIDGIQFLTGSGVYPIPRVEFHTPYGWVPLRHLGYGYQTVIAWMIDFASRMIERYPDIPDPLAEPAVVLVDEIDLHLHPLWQRQLIGYLSRQFPNTQFIATAHSPLVVQAATGANLAVLRRDGDRVVIDNDVATIRNWRIDQVLTSDLFGLPSARPPELDKLLDRRQALLTKARLTKADQRELADLEAKMGALPVGETLEQARRLELIEETLELLKREQAEKP